MQIIRRDRLLDFQRQYADARGQLRAWYDDTRRAEWARPTDVTGTRSNARTLPGGIAIFDIRGNAYRLIVRINYQLGLVEPLWFGPHSAYSRLDLTAL